MSTLLTVPITAEAVIHLTLPDGSEHQLTPDEASAIIKALQDALPRKQEIDLSKMLGGLKREPLEQKPKRPTLVPPYDHGKTPYDRPIIPMWRGDGDFTCTTSRTFSSPAE